MTRRIFFDYLTDICDALGKCMEFTEGMTFEQFKKDEKTAYAVIRALEIAGEAAKNVPDEWKADHPDIPWKEMAGMRDVLIHQYFGIDYSVIWKTISQDIKQIFPLFQKMLEDAGNSRDISQ